MSRALMLALAVALALPSAAIADEIQTSQGTKHLPPVLSLVSADQLNAASAQAEQTLVVLMRDVAEQEKGRRAVASDASNVVSHVGSDRDAIERLRVDYEQANTKFTADMDAYDNAQAALNGEIQQQRAQSAALEVLPSAERDVNEVQRLNAWADQIQQKRSQLEIQRNTLMTGRADVEDKRIKYTSAKADAERRLGDSRSQLMSREGTANAGMAVIASQLHACVDYLDRVRGYYPLRTRKAAPASPLLDQARQLLKRLDAMR